MVCCPNCSHVLEEKEGKKKFCAQIGNPELAIIETENPKFCGSCNEYFLETEEVVNAIMQIKESQGKGMQNIDVGIDQ